MDFHLHTSEITKADLERVDNVVKQCAGAINQMIVPQLKEGEEKVEALSAVVEKLVADVAALKALVNG